MEEMSPMALAGRGGVFLADNGEVGGGGGGGRIEVLGLVGKVPIVRCSERERLLGEGTTRVRIGIRTILDNKYRLSKIWFFLRVQS